MADGLERIILHWTAGNSRQPSDADLAAYHYLIDAAGDTIHGQHEPEDNISTADQDYAPHVLNLNTGSIGLALMGMRGAVESPFSKGSDPITVHQVEAMAVVAARLATEWRIPVTRRTILSHAEVQPTLGVKQRAKWDIAWLPGMPKAGDPVEVGDRLRAMIESHLPATPDTSSAEIAALKAELAAAQKALAEAAVDLKVLGDEVQAMAKRASSALTQGARPELNPSRQAQAIEDALLQGARPALTRGANHYEES